MKKIILILLGIAILTSGCKDGEPFPPGTEIDELMFIRVIAVDKSTSDDVMVTASALKVGGVSSGGGPSPSKPVPLRSEAKSVFTAERSFQAFTDKRVFFGHSEFFLIGEDAAREGIVKYIDFLSRDHELRLNSKLLISYGNAGKLMEKSSASDYYLSNHLESLLKDDFYSSVTNPVTLLDFISVLDSDCPCGAIPAVMLTNESDQFGALMGDRSDVQLNGYAIFKDFKLIGFLQRPLARGYNFLINKVKSGTIDIHVKDKDQKDTIVSLELLGATTQVVTEIENNKLKGIIYKVKAESNIDEIQSNKIDLDEKHFELFIQKKTEIIKGEMEKVISYAQQNKADFIKAFGAFSFQHPILAENYKKDWDKVFSTLPIKVEVDTRIKRTYDFKESVGHKKEGEK